MYELSPDDTIPLQTNLSVCVSVWRSPSIVSRLLGGCVRIGAGVDVCDVGALLIVSSHVQIFDGQLLVTQCSAHHRSKPGSDCQSSRARHFGLVVAPKVVCKNLALFKTDLTKNHGVLFFSTFVCSLFKT